MRRKLLKYAAFGALGLPIAVWAGCSDKSDAPSTTIQAQEPSQDQVPLPPGDIPRFAHELPIPRTFAPTVVTEGGQVVRHEYTVSAARTQVQMLPPGFPQTMVLAFGGNVQVPGTTQTEFVRSVPGPIFENVRGVPALVRWRNEILQPHFMPVDPTLHWANPERMESPVAPFIPFPPGYPNAQFPVPLVVHNHGLEIENEMDGLAEQWFTPFHHRGPDFHTRDYLKLNVQPPTQLFYHDHTMGITRLNVAAGLVGTAYYVRDPNDPIEPLLPSGDYEIPLVLFNRGFFTDGNINFPRESGNPDNAYFAFGTGANASLVNGKVWPNLNVERRQYRFRVLAADNAQVFNVALSQNGNPVPMTIIGSDGGYLPEPTVVENFQIGITERADILVDFSGFEPGTQIFMLNENIAPEDPRHEQMRFTVMDTPVVPPTPLPPVLNERPVFATDAPTRFKTMRLSTDHRGNTQTLLDGLHFTAPATEFPLVGSTEQWDLIQLAGVSHQIHLHLIQFQVLDRQAIDAAAYNQQWLLVNGFKPYARQIVVDPTPFLDPAGPVPPEPYEIGWKDTVRAPGNMVTRIRARWAPQEVATDGSTPGVNQFPIDPTTGRGYMWHCHVLSHEDNEMMRPMPLVNAWMPGVNYEVGTVVTFQDVNYRVRLAHTSSAGQPPNTQFAFWERVNNNDGTWEPQIIYDAGDRVLHNGELFVALHFHQAQPGQTPPTLPAMWLHLPQTACGQFAILCEDPGFGHMPGHMPDPAAEECLALGQAGDEEECLDQLQFCMSACTAPIHPPHIHSPATPCHGLCANPVEFDVPDDGNFQSGPLGTGAACYATKSNLRSGTCSSFAGGRTLTVNGREMPCGSGNWPEPLPPERNDGYCIQTTPGNHPWAAFAVW